MQWIIIRCCPCQSFPIDHLSHLFFLKPKLRKEIVLANTNGLNSFLGCIITPCKYLLKCVKNTRDNEKKKFQASSFYISSNVKQTFLTFSTHFGIFFVCCNLGAKQMYLFFFNVLLFVYMELPDDESLLFIFDYKMCGVFS